jgi:AcrR family transcriptional regulator
VNDSQKLSRERILATTREMYTTASMSSVTMDKVASAAGIGRATLYRYFKNRDDLLLAVLEAEALLIADRVEKRIRKIQNPGEHIIEGMVQAVDEIDKSELLHNIFRTDDNSAINRLLFDTDKLINIGLGIILPMAQRAEQSGQLKSDMDFEMLVEWMLRILISLVTIPSKQLNSKKAIRRMLRAILLPVLEG